MDKLNIKNLIRLILIYEVVLILISLLSVAFAPDIDIKNFFSYYSFHWETTLTLAIGVPIATVSIYLILKWDSKKK